jgi:hypothetical protein
MLRRLALLAPALPHHFAEGDDTGAGSSSIAFSSMNSKDGRVFDGVAELPQKAPAVGADVLDYLEHEATGGVASPVWHPRWYPPEGWLQSSEERPATPAASRQQAKTGAVRGWNAHQIHIKVAHVILCFTGQPTDECHAGGIAVADETNIIKVMTSICERQDSPDSPE